MRESAIVAKRSAAAVIDLVLDDLTLAFIEERVAKGEYADASEVVREGLKLLQLRESRAHLNHLLAEARAEYDRGEFRTLTSELLDEIEREIDENERLGIEIELDPDVVPKTKA